MSEKTTLGEKTSSICQSDVRIYVHVSYKPLFTSPTMHHLRTATLGSRPRVEHDIFHNILAFCSAKCENNARNTWLCTCLFTCHDGITNLQQQPASPVGGRGRCMRIYHLYQKSCIVSSI